MNWLIRQIAKVTLIGKLVEKLGHKVPIIFIFIALIFSLNIDCEIFSLCFFV